VLGGDAVHGDGGRIVVASLLEEAFALVEDDWVAT
jgi:hypothetical protein